MQQTRRLSSLYFHFYSLVFIITFLFSSKKKTEKKIETLKQAKEKRLLQCCCCCCRGWRLDDEAMDQQTDRPPSDQLVCLIRPFVRQFGESLLSFFPVKKQTKAPRGVQWSNMESPTVTTERRADVVAEKHDPSFHRLSRSVWPSTDCGRIFYFNVHYTLH